MPLAITRVALFKTPPKAEPCEVLYPISIATVGCITLKNDNDLKLSDSSLLHSSAPSRTANTVENLVVRSSAIWLLKAKQCNYMVNEITT